MAEQKAVANYLQQPEAIDRFLTKFRKDVEFRLRSIYNGFVKLKNEGHPIDAIAPQAAIYLTIKLDLVGKTTAEGKKIEDQSEVTAYLLNEAKLAIVPFYAFGASKTSAWYRLSVGTCKEDEIDEMLGKLGDALRKLK